MPSAVNDGGGGFGRLCVCFLRAAIVDVEKGGEGGLIGRELWEYNAVRCLFCQQSFCAAARSPCTNEGQGYSS